MKTAGVGTPSVSELAVVLGKGKHCFNTTVLNTVLGKEWSLPDHVTFGQVVGSSVPV